MEQNDNLDHGQLQKQNPGQVRVLSDAGYPVAPFKFILMSALTFNLYSIYWAYKNFVVLDTTPVKRPKILAVCSSIFLTLTFYWLLKYIEEAAARQGKKINLHKGFLAAAYFALHFIEVCVGRANMGNFITEAVSLTSIFVNILIMMVPLRAVLQLSQSSNPPVPVDFDFSIKNYVFMVLGGIVTILGIIGAFIPD